MRREDRVEENQWEEMLVREEKERRGGERGYSEDYFDKGKNNIKVKIRIRINIRIKLGLLKLLK